MTNQQDIADMLHRAISQLHIAPTTLSFAMIAFIVAAAAYLFIAGWIAERDSAIGSLHPRRRRF